MFRFGLFWLFLSVFAGVLGLLLLLRYPRARRNGFLLFSGSCVSVAACVMFLLVVSEFSRGRPAAAVNLAEQPQSAPTPRPLKAEPENSEAATQKLNPTPAPAKAEPVMPDSECKLDLECWAKRHYAKAHRQCKSLIEMSAKYDFEWQTRWLTGVYLKGYMWGDDAHNKIDYYGDRIKLQNGFGAWSNYIYICTLDTSSGAVADLQMEPGRLPGMGE